MKKHFEMNVIGEEQSVAGFVGELVGDKIPDLTVTKRTAGELSNGKPYVETLCSGTLDGPVAEELRALSKEKGVIAELYAQDEDRKAQEHVIVDRGSFFQNCRRELEPYNIRDMTETEVEDFLNWEGLTKEEFLAQAKDGVFYTGGFENFMKMSPHLSFYLTQDPREFFEYDSTYGGKFYVTMDMGIYNFGNNLYLNMGAYDEDLGALDIYGDITVNIAPLPYLYAAIDTNNNGDNISALLENSGLGQNTCRVMNSGFCQYPVFKFDEEKLRQLFPEKLEEYAQLHGVLLKDRKPSLDKLISGAKEKTAPAEKEPKEQEFEK